LRDAIQALLDACIEDGSLRDGVPANDIMMALGGISLIAEHESERELASRLINLLLAGLVPL
jgi:hypothetical protein